MYGIDIYKSQKILCLLYKLFRDKLHLHENRTEVGHVFRYSNSMVWAYIPVTQLAGNAVK